MNPLAARMRGHRSDLILAAAVFALVSVGLIMMYSISPIISKGYATFFNQLKYAAIGLAAWLVVARVPYTYWKRVAPHVLALAVILTFLLIPFGHSNLGATRWVQLGPITFQPAELLKLGLIIYLAAWFDRRRHQSGSFTQGVLPFVAMVGAACGLIALFQRDLGTAIVLAAAAVGVYAVAGLKREHFIMLALLGLSLILMLIMVAPHRVSRLTTFLHPSKDPTGQGYQVDQALIGVGSGGLFGVGLGKSVQVWGYLPESSTDSIFAVMGEELGLIGCLVILTLYSVVIYRGFEIARTSPDQFARYLATGIVLWLGVQTLINVGAMLAVVPLTGIPLPYISYGGTNLIISLVGAGILLNISKFTTKTEEGHAHSRQWRGDGGPRIANPSYSRRAPSA